MLVMAWLVGEGIVTWRTFKHGAPPTPGQLAAVSGFFVLLAVLAQYQPAKGVAAAIGVGVDIAAFLQVLPGTGQPVHLTRTWPPAQITDPTIFLPNSGGASGGSNTVTPGAPAAPRRPPPPPPPVLPPPRP